MIIGLAVFAYLLTVAGFITRAAEETSQWNNIGAAPALLSALLWPLAVLFFLGAWVADL